MNRSSPFSYQCNACGRCCADKVITLSPYDVLRIARAASVTTVEAVGRFTIRRGSVLRFDEHGRCVALDGVRCGLHGGRPLACRLYPLGISRRDGDGEEQFITLEAATGSLGVYEESGSVADFLASQDVTPYLEANSRYASLIPVFRERIAAVADFDRVEPREFWRRAVREALAETACDPNPIIDAMFDADGIGCGRARDSDTVSEHVERLAAMTGAESRPETLAAAAVLLAVSLGYPPAHAMVES